MFRGTHRARLDRSGRLKLPAAFRDEINRQYGPEFFITSVDGRVINIYPMSEWDKVEASLVAIPDDDIVKQEFRMRISYYGHQATMDAQGRIFLPAQIRDLVAADGDVVIIGMQNWLSVADAASFRLPDVPLADDARKLLEGFFSQRCDNP